MKIHPICLMLILLLSITKGFPAPSADELGYTVSKTTLESRRTLEEVREHVAEAFAPRADEVTAETDLILDLGLDPTDVHYWLLELFDALGIQPSKRQLTRVSEIAAYIDKAEPLDIASEKGIDGIVVSKELESYLQTVFFATNRLATGQDKPEGKYSGERRVDTRIDYGVASVNIPMSHKKGRLESPFMQIRALRDPRRHIYILSLDALEEEGFFSELKSATSAKEDLLVYLHGFNVSFEDAIKRAAQISFDFGFRGAPMAFTWPSDGGAGFKSVLRYNADWQDILWSVKHIEGFLSMLGERFSGRKIHIVAHSMGSKGLLYAMRLLAYRNPAPPRFGTVMLCAPDFDADLFRQQLSKEIRRLADHWLIYTSSKDVALIASERLNVIPRLGNTLTWAEGFEIIDASELEVTPWSLPETHSYYATKKLVIDDMIQAIRGVPPEQRGLEPKTLAAGSVWVLR